MSASVPWPDLPWRDWGPTIDTMHRWAQIAGKVRMALTPPVNHWWHTTLYVTPTGLTTGTMPAPDGSVDVSISFDFVAHRLDIVASSGGRSTIPLRDGTVAEFYARLLADLAALGAPIRIRRRPVEMADATPFDEDDRPARYDPSHAEACFRGLAIADRLLREFRSGFVGKASPVQFFWGSFDLAQARYSGRPAPRHPGGAPNCPDWVMEEAYSREEMAAGWWPGSEPPGPAFYAYAYPEPAGFAAAHVPPDASSYDAHLGEFILPWDDVRTVPDPDAAVASFLQGAYAAAADLGGWDRATLEPTLPTDPRPTGPWSLVEPDGAGDSPPRAQGRRPGEGADGT